MEILSEFDKFKPKVVKSLSYGSLQNKMYWDLMNFTRGFKTLNLNKNMQPFLWGESG